MYSTTIATIVTVCAVAYFANIALVAYQMKPHVSSNSGPGAGVGYAIIAMAGVIPFAGGMFASVQIFRTIGLSTAAWQVVAVFIGATVAAMVIIPLQKWCYARP